MDMQPISPDQPLAVTLSAQEWNTVMSAVNELPHRVARPLFDRIVQQLQQQSQPQMPMPRGNEIGRNDMGGMDRLHTEEIG